MAKAKRAVKSAKKPAAKQQPYRSPSAMKPRMVINKQWKDADLINVADKHGKKPKTFIEDLVRSVIDLQKMHPDNKVIITIKRGGKS